MLPMSSHKTPEELRKSLVDLLTDVEVLLKGQNLRAQVQALVPCERLLKELGSSLIPSSTAQSAQQRILAYFLKYPGVVLSRHELDCIAGISEWARRVRELRVQYGWSILSGLTAREMAKEDDLLLGDVKAKTMRIDDYILTDTKQDADAASRWQTANRIRKRRDLGSRGRLLEYFKLHVGTPVTGEELRYVANEANEWPRRIRELRTEQGWPISTKKTGRPDLPIGVYVLESVEQLQPHDRAISDSVRVAVLKRDEFKCTRCGWNYADAKPDDPRKRLELHHDKPHSLGGANTADNLITLCNVCHVQAHRHLS